MQFTINIIVFVGAFIAMNYFMETLKGLSYKLNIMGIPIVGLSYIYGDNMSVIHKML